MEKFFNYGFNYMRFCKQIKQLTKRQINAKIFWLFHSKGPNTHVNFKPLAI
jgi:hypothetical protein